MITQQEEVRAAVKELHGEGAGWRSPDRVVSTADAQNWDSCLVHISEGVIAIPVSIPSGGAAPGLAEENFLQFPERLTLEQSLRLHDLCQCSGIPRRDKHNRRPDRVTRHSE
uniref:Uncharacterized protein n=1 Tax=Pelusios castaneus TaxID=367368 RepID=A0A8C8S770_9SAUR